MSRIIGVGAALVDLVSEVSESWVQAQGAEKGGMTLVEWPRMETMLGTLSQWASVPGGASCNTMRGIGKLGGSAAFLGKVGQDEVGDLFRKSLVESHVEDRLIEASTPTGRVLSAVTPDAHRSMFTYLGASAETTPADLQATSFQNGNLIYLEGYIAYNAPWFHAVADAAHAAGIPLGIDFGSFNVIDHCRSVLDEVFAKGKLELLVANEDEAKSYTGLEEEAALRALMPLAKIAIVKLGKEGALVGCNGEVIRVKAFPVKAMDTTGAGDLWAAGFLYAYKRNAKLEDCALLAARVASEVVQVIGPAIPEYGYERIRQSAEYNKV